MSIKDLRLFNRIKKINEATEEDYSAMDNADVEGYGDVQEDEVAQDEAEVMPEGQEDAGEDEPVEQDDAVVQTIDELVKIVADWYDNVDPEDDEKLEKLSAKISEWFYSDDAMEGQEDADVESEDVESDEATDTDESDESEDEEEEEEEEDKVEECNKKGKKKKMTEGSLVEYRGAIDFDGDEPYSFYVGKEGDTRPKYRGINKVDKFGYGDKEAKEAEAEQERLAGEIKKRQKELYKK